MFHRIHAIFFLPTLAAGTLMESIIAPPLPDVAATFPFINPEVAHLGLKTQSLEMFDRVCYQFIYALAKRPTPISMDDLVGLCDAPSVEAGSCSYLAEGLADSIKAKMNRKSNGKTIGYKAWCHKVYSMQAGLAKASTSKPADSEEPGHKTAVQQYPHVTPAGKAQPGGMLSPSKAHAEVKAPGQASHVVQKETPGVRTVTVSAHTEATSTTNYTAPKAASSKVVFRKRVDTVSVAPPSSEVGAIFPFINPEVPHLGLQSQKVDMFNRLCYQFIYALAKRDTATAKDDLVKLCIGTSVKAGNCSYLAEGLADSIEAKRTAKNNGKKIGYQAWCNKVYTSQAGLAKAPISVKLNPAKAPADKPAQSEKPVHKTDVQDRQNVMSAAAAPAMAKAPGQSAHVVQKEVPAVHMVVSAHKEVTAATSYTTPKFASSLRDEHARHKYDVLNISNAEQVKMDEELRKERQRIFKEYQKAASRKTAYNMPDNKLQHVVVKTSTTTTTSLECFCFHRYGQLVCKGADCARTTTTATMTTLQHIMPARKRLPLHRQEQPVHTLHDKTADATTDDTKGLFGNIWGALRSMAGFIQWTN